MNQLGNATLDANHGLEQTPLPAPPLRLLKRLRRREQFLQTRIERLARLGERMGWLRLLVFTGGVLLSLSAYFAGIPLAAAALVVLAIVSFILVINRHQRLDRHIRQYVAWVAHTREQIGRMTLAWDQIPPSRLSAAPDHPFALDLDLIGSRSLHQLLDTAISAEGSQRLGAWLLTQQPDAAAIKQRQTLVGELRDQALFRDKLTVRGLSAAKQGRGWNGSALTQWLDQHTVTGYLPALVLILAVLGVFNIAAFALSLIMPVPPILRAVAFGLYAAISISQVRLALGLFDRVADLADGLGQMDAIFTTVERHSFRTAPALRAFCAPFLDAATQPRTFLRRVNRLIGMAGLQNSQVVWLVLNALLPWDLFVAWRLQVERQRLAEVIPAWLEIWFELEALNSLANFAALNPSYTFPVISDTFAFEAEGLGHPLIPAARKVANSVAIPALGSLTIITGSNMSGKSSFLRTVGVNLVLAYAGGVVDARHLRLSLFRLFSCIRVSDSLADGFSYFYAEVRRLKALLDALAYTAENPSAPPPPLFYLIDEIFRGTNNRERLQGSRAFLRALAGRNGCGAISTHDLDLVQLAEALPAVRNMHFADNVEAGKMTFDYLLRMGPCPTTNALRIMQLEGLPVDMNQT